MRTYIEASTVNQKLVMERICVGYKTTSMKAAHIQMQKGINVFTEKCQLPDHRRVAIFRYTMGHQRRSNFVEQQWQCRHPEI